MKGKRLVQRTYQINKIEIWFYPLIYNLITTDQLITWTWSIHHHVLPFSTLVSREVNIALSHMTFLCICIFSWDLHSYIVVQVFEGFDHLLFFLSISWQTGMCCSVCKDYVHVWCLIWALRVHLCKMLLFKQLFDCENFDFSSIHFIHRKPNWRL